jgi:iron complex outermembrane receptor protein
MTRTSPRFHRRRASLIPALIPTLFAAAALRQAQAADAQVPTVSVVGQMPPGEASSYISIDHADAGTSYRVGRDGIDLLGAPGSSNPYTVIDRLPSVNGQTADAYGLVNIPGGTKGLRVRGELSSHGGGGSVDGLPLTGINPGPGNQWLFDMENIAAVSLGQGPIAPDHLAFFTTGGALDSEIRWPQAQRGFQAGQSLGSHDFRRTFVRADSGLLGDGSDLFLSASYTQADKWRGPGQAPSGRSNAEGAWSRPLGEHANARLLFAYNDVKADNYRPLTYAQASDLNTWRDFDFSSTSSATPSAAVNYFAYNRQNFDNWTAIGEFDYALGEGSGLSVKPYYLKEKGDYFDGMANGKVRRWLIDHDWYGLTAEWKGRLADTGIKLGYWVESSAPPGPPTAWKMYNPTGGGGLGGAMWSILADTTARHRFDSLYVLADRSDGALKTEAGVRYVRETLPGFNFHNTAGIGDVSYDQALSQSSGVIANRSVNSFAISEFLPFVGVGYTLGPATDLKLSLGRNYGSPAFDVWPVFQQNSTTFLTKGYTIDKLWHHIKAETATALDLGLNVRTERGYFAPTLFYSRNHNKNVSFDPGIGVAYSQNVGKTHAYGIQAAAGWSPLATLDLFATAAYDRNVFDEDLKLLNGTTLAVSGKQLPDTPQWSANLGGSWHYGELSASPLLRYTGMRYGDTQQVQKVAGYLTADFTLAYKLRLAGAKWGSSLSVVNLFDKRYVGFINASYYQLLSNSSAYYYPGAPRTVVAKLTLDF